MPKNKRRKPTAEVTDIRSIVIKILIGSAFNIILFAAMCAVCSLICLKADIDSRRYKLFIFFISAVSGFFGGFKAVGSVRRNGMFLGVLSALPSFLIIFLVSSIISRTGMAASGLIAAVIMAVFSAVGGIISVNKRR